MLPGRCLLMSWDWMASLIIVWSGPEITASALCSHTGACVHKGVALDLMQCYHHFEIFLNFWIARSHFYFALDSCKFCSWSWSRPAYWKWGGNHPLKDMAVTEIQPLYPGTELNLRDRVLGEVEKNNFVALPGATRLSALKTICPELEGLVRRFIVMV